MLDRNIDFSEDSRPQNRLTVSHNLIEPYVLEAVERQFLGLPEKTKDFVSKSDVVAYTLNRLPALYATTKEGLRRQNQRIDHELITKIDSTVKQGFAAVKLDPFRFSEPLYSRNDESAERILQELKVFLKAPNLSWQNLTEIIKRKLCETARGEITWKQPKVFDWEEISTQP